MIRVATDIGGTFTDLVYLDELSGRIGLSKVSSTSPRYDEGVMQVLQRAGIRDLETVTSFAHGTTVVINAITQRTGDKTALITTAGFRDVLELGRANRPDIYNLRYKKPRPFVERRLRYEVRERINHKGEVLVPLQAEEVRAAALDAQSEEATAIAVCFLHSYANPEHELACRELISDVYPDAAVTLSHEISMEWREFERTSTAVLNAFVQRVVGEYIGRLEAGLDQLGVGRQRYVMRSNGGTMSFQRARQAPITVIESGPVGGVIGASLIARLLGEQRVISMDIGGTTAKTSLIENGEVKSNTDYRIDWRPDSPGYPVKTAVVDIVEIGAGGGSIAWIDEAGVVRVGPRSAGASPGPACYPNGGSEPTVTDANLLMGRINPDYVLGGELKVSTTQAAEAMRRLGRAVGMKTDESARGVIRLANASMVNAMKLVSIRRGYDPRDFVIVAFGGGGSMHAGALAREMHVRKVIVPRFPAHFSAWGMLGSDIREDFARTRALKVSDATADLLNETWADLEQTAIHYLVDEEHIAADRLHFSRACDMRYVGQEHTVRVPVGTSRLEAGAEGGLEAAFHGLHEQRYTFRLDAPAEFVNFHLAAIVQRERMAIPRIQAPPSNDVESASKPKRIVDFGEYGLLTTQIFERDLLPIAMTIGGPAIVEEPAASTVVYPGDSFQVDGWGNLVMHVAAV